MRADIHDGQGARNAPCNGPNTDARDQLSPDHYIRLAPHGRSIQKYMVKRSWPPSKDGAPSCVTTHLTSRPWTYSLPRPLASNLLYAFVIVRLARRDLVWINVTPHP